MKKHNMNTNVYFVSYYNTYFFGEKLNFLPNQLVFTKSRNMVTFCFETCNCSSNIIATNGMNGMWHVLA